MAVTVHGVAGLVGLAGADLGRTDWLEITQDRVNMFADASGDHQWIHVDPARAATGPFGTTIAHGYLTLSLVVPLMGRLLRVEGVRMGINYGLNKVRFPTPVPVGSKIRLAARLGTVAAVTDDAVEAVVDLTVELDGAAKPACVAQAIYRYYAA